MRSLRSRKRIIKSDFARVLLSETLPYETPLIFSNEGLYDRIKDSDPTHTINAYLKSVLILKENPQFRPPSTIPYQYKINKDTLGFRRLAILHPMAQWRFCQFYKTYTPLLLYYCRHSPISIRAPKSVAGSFYTKSAWDNLHRYKTGKINQSSTDHDTKHTPTYFSYKGYDRLYRFFNSHEYLNLEKRYSVLWTLDVAKCFDSIYTHSLSWATKDKSFTKAHIKSYTFAQQFDAVMQFANHSETNGIAIGPEISRIFAEILFQRCDQEVIARLRTSSAPLVFGSDYTVRRYVDDIFIFSRTDADAHRIYETYADTLVSFNLHLNDQKAQRLKPPFLTAKSTVTHEVLRIATAFFEGLFSTDGGFGTLTPRHVKYSSTRIRHFVDSVKGACAASGVGYGEVSYFLVSLFAERVKRLANVNLTNKAAIDRVAYRDCFMCLAELMYFFYGVALSVGASYKLCVAIIVMIRFTKTQLREHFPTVAERMCTLTTDLIESQKVKLLNVDGFVPLEVINVLLATRELGDIYLLSESAIRDTCLGPETTRRSYFRTVSCLFYIGGLKRYASLRAEIVDSIDEQLNAGDFRRSAELTCLFLDSITCPHIDPKTRAKWIRRLYQLTPTTPPTKATLVKMLSTAADYPWFVNWSRCDILTTLERRELKKVY